MLNPERQIPKIKASTCVSVVVHGAFGRVLLGRDDEGVLLVLL